jgi:hypothetical protein
MVTLLIYQLLEWRKIPLFLIQNNKYSRDVISSKFTLTSGTKIVKFLNAGFHYVVQAHLEL